MARSSEEEQRAKRRKRLTRGLVLGAAAFGLPALYNVWVARRAQGLALPSWGRAQFTESPLGALAFRHLSADADGVPLVLMHSLAPGHSSSHWQAVAQTAATARPVVALDWPGWGESERRRASYSPPLLAASLESVIAAANLDNKPVTLVAAGLACVPALLWAQAELDRVNDIVLVCPRGWRDDRPQFRDQVLRGLLDIPILGTSAVHVATSRRSLEGQLVAAFANPDKIPRHLLDEHERFSHLPNTRSALTAYFTGRLEQNISDIFVDLDRPIHLVWGRASSSPDIAEADLWINRRDVPLTVIEDAGSLPHLETPEAFMRILST